MKNKDEEEVPFRKIDRTEEQSSNKTREEERGGC